MKVDNIRRISSNRTDSFTLAGVKKNYAPDLKLEPIHTEIHLTVDVAKQVAKGHALITIRARISDVKTLTLDAIDFDELSVTDIGGQSVTYHYDDKRIRISYEQAFCDGEERIVRIDYSIKEPISGLKFSRPDKQRPDLPLFAITDNETERARYWFPCVDFPTVRPKMDYYLTAAEDLTILANGALVHESLNGGLKTAHWKLDYPCPSYLACFAIGEFSEFQDEALRHIPIAYYADKSYTPEQLKRTFGATREMLIWMEQKLGMDFPYPKYFQIAGREIGGAMENISLVTWDDKFMLDETMGREWQYIMDLINVHEMSHSYFGDAVVAYDFAHVWLKESWATYIESVWLEDSEGKDAMDWQMAEEARSYMEEVKNKYVRPIITREYDHSWNMFDMHLYPGGAWRLHMLRHLVGDAQFWSGVQTYINTYAGKTVKTLDFQRCIEKASGLNLDNFFDMWFYSKGYPMLKVDFEYDKDKRRGKFTIEQKQVDSKKGVQLFDFNLEVSWQDHQGQDFLEILQLRKAVQVFQLQMDEPQHLILDPQMKTLFEAEFNPGNDKLRHLLVNGKTVRSLMQAVSELAKTGKRKNLQAIRDYMVDENRWGLRLHVYRALGTVGNAYAYDHLAELLVGENNPMVIEGAARACGAHRHPTLRKAILEKLQSNDLPYRGQMILLESLGKQKNKEDIPVLMQYVKQTGWRNLVRAGAFLGLGSMHSEAVVDALLDGIDQSVTFYDEKVSRLNAVADLYDWLPGHLQKKLSLALCEATEDPSSMVQISAARNLGAARIREGILSIEALFGQVPVQDHPFLKRQIKKIQATVGMNEGKKLQKQLDDLGEQLAKMEKRLQEVESEA